MQYTVELEPGVWIAPWEGDPGRTLVRANAKVFATKRRAYRALQNARRNNHRDFRPAKIRPLVESSNPAGTTED